MLTFHFLLVLLRQLYKFATNMGNGLFFVASSEELGVRSEELGGKR